MINPAPGSSGSRSAAPSDAPDGHSPERAWPVREISLRLRDYVARLNRVWIEGQILDVSRRSGAVVYLTVRDTDVDASVTVVIAAQLDRALRPPLEAGQRVRLHVQCEFWMRNGRLMLRAGEVQPVGVGELLATLERRKQQLAAEGLFASALKRRLPLLPRRIGLITGVNAQAGHDVVANARLRWPAALFEIREGPVQGPAAVPSMVAALRFLDAADEVDVIVFARGGGSVEDLLPFSDESLIRAVAAARTPVVSAIGHEQDSPLLDLVADLRASTPTDAGRRIVPDWAEESRRASQARGRLQRVLVERLRHEQTWLDQVRSRPALADPAGILPALEAGVRDARRRLERAVDTRLGHAQRDLDHARARARTLSPLATLDRGYAVVVGPSGLVRSADELGLDDEVRVRVSRGDFSARVTDVASAP